VAGCTITAVLGDLTELQVDAIVNAANGALAHGGGLAGAIVRRGGWVIQEESDRLAPVPPGDAATTGAGTVLVTATRSTSSGRRPDRNAAAPIRARTSASLPATSRPASPSAMD